MRVNLPTRRRVLFDELRQREEQLAEAQAISRIGSWDWERDNPGPVRWSAELYRLCGVTPETFSPTVEGFVSFLDERDHAAALAAFEVLMKRGQPMRLDVRLARADDDPQRWLRIRGVAKHGPEGELTELRGTMQDVSEIKRSEHGLAFLSVLGKVANDAATLAEALRAAGETLRPFARWPAVLVGVPRRHGSTEMVWTLSGWTTTGEAEEQVARQLGEDVIRERRLLFRTGAAGTLLVGGVVEVGDQVACVLVADTRARTQPTAPDRAIFEQVLATCRAVAEREWAARELAAARDEALAASRAKSQFLTTMSHEIRTPLNGVIGLSELLARTPLDERQRQFAEGVDQAGRTLLALVNDILDLSKIEAGRVELEQVVFDPRAVVEQSVALVAESAAEKGLRLVVSCAEDVPARLRGDPVRLGQVVTNLAANAVKFTHHGSVVVRATGRLRLEVEDTGVGIRPEAQTQIFEPFSQADSSTTREYGGTGLGLDISRRLVELMGGQIGFTSELGAGSTFWFDVPLAVAEPPEPGAEPDRRGGWSPDHGHRPEGAGARGAEGRGAGLRGRALVVEDNAVNQVVARGVLESLGFEVEVVDHGGEAVAAMTAAPSAYDVVLMDCQMPVMDGYDATRAIRAMAPPAGRVPIVAMTAAVASQERERCLAAGMDDFLSKPVDVAALEAALVRWVRPGRDGEPSAAALPAAPGLPDEPAPLAVPAVPEETGAVARLALLVEEGVSVSVVRRMVERFSTSAHSGLAEVERALGAGPVEVSRAVHTLRGSAENLGLVRLAACCAVLEQRARRGDMPAPADLVELRAAVEEAVVEVAEAVGSMAVVETGPEPAAGLRTGSISRPVTPA